MAAINEITGDSIQTRQSNENYRNNYDLIFGKNKPTKVCNSKIETQDLCDVNVPCDCDVNLEDTPGKP